jgi:hypothetical protein
VRIRRPHCAGCEVAVGRCQRPGAAPMALIMRLASAAAMRLKGQADDKGSLLH